ncbi:shikimate dehydrogenase family protein [Thalassospira australica]|uniref:shikimate dehydrogenase family protein n=1 Tax=Thalassospira australica TaxID=1528106 RepID=UPI00051A1743|nr:hypothetical protein [Thalassospira australica]
MKAAIPTITGTTMCYPLLGHPVAQVSTPPTINGWFAEQSIDAVMFAVDTPPATAEEFFRMLRTWQNCGGCSVTVPHKQVAFRVVDELTARAHRSSSVNIISRLDDGRLIGDMTDGLAMVEALRLNGVTLSGKSVMLVGGGGGAGAAIADALCESGVANLHLVERDEKRRDYICSALKSAYRDVSISLAAADVPESVDLAINATALGMQQIDPLPFDPRIVRKDGIVADVVTKPAETALLRTAERLGRRIQSGKEMATAQLEFQMRHLELWPAVKNTVCEEG